MKRTAVIWDERFVRHRMGLTHPESPSRLLAIKQVLDGDGVGRDVERREPRAATKEELCYIHEAGYVEKVERTAGSEMVHLDPDTVACSETWEAARYAAGATIVLVDDVIKGKITNGFAFVRPPGHHAEKGAAMGFCFFNNIAIGAEYARRICGLERIAIIDFDVHHGNGTQHAFYERDDVFFTSLHRLPFYPGTGAANETGAGRGKGTTLNIPMEEGAGDDDYKKAFDRHIVPAVLRFEPQLILVSAGYDAHANDPLGGMRMTPDGFKWIARTIADLAGECSQGRVVYALEGGYDLKALRESVEATLEVMLA